MSVPHIKPLKGTREFKFKQSKYEHLDGMCPIRALAIGPSGSSKTTTVTNLIVDVFSEAWERTYIFSKNAKTDHAWEPVVKFLRNVKKVPEEEEIMYEDFDVEALNKIISQQKSHIDYQKKHNHKTLHQICIVIDDWGGSPEIMRHSKGKMLQELFLMGRHYGINIIICLQKITLASTVMRVNCTLLMYWKARNFSDLDKFLEENSALVEGGKKTLMQIYKKATETPYGFLTVNMLSKDPSKIFMKNFEAYLVANTSP